MRVESAGVMLRARCEPRSCPATSRHRQPAGITSHPDPPRTGKTMPPGCRNPPDTALLLTKYIFPLGSLNLFHRDRCVVVLPTRVKLSKALAVCWDELSSAAGIQVCSSKTKKKKKKSHIFTAKPCAQQWGLDTVLWLALCTAVRSHPLTSTVTGGYL